MASEHRLRFFTRGIPLSWQVVVWRLWKRPPGRHRPGSRALVVRTDVTDIASVRALFAKTQETFGRLDLLFNNAGIGAPAHSPGRSHLRAMEIGRRYQPDRHISVHPGSVQDHEGSAARGGRIINNGSVSAHVPRVYSAPYTATKHAITGLTRSTSLDGRKYDIACGQIDIGNAATERTERMNAGVPQAHGSVAVEPRMDADDVARAVVYMASLPLDANVQFITVMATKMPYIGRG